MDQGRKKKKSGRSNWQRFNEARAKRKLEQQMAANRAQQSPLNWSPEKRLRSKASMPEIKCQLRPQRVFIPLVDQEVQTALSLPTDKVLVEVTVAPRAASQDRHDQEDAEMQRKKMAQFLAEVSEEWGLNSESGCEEDLDLLSVKEEEASVEGECGCQPDVDRSDSVKEEEASVEGECGCQPDVDRSDSVKEEEASVEGECGCQPDVDRSDSVKEEEASVEGECGC